VRRRKAELQHLRLANGDRLLLCTDGLTDMLSEAAVADVLRGLEGSHKASRALIDMALEAGGRDNVTGLRGDAAGRIP
jgi:serine/threonine protein phosphatase PrpC